jgi:hypothetical protein
MGAPNATATPAADEAAYISLIEKADFERLNRRLTVCPVHTATWTLGPSFPTLNPDAIASGKVIVLIPSLKVSTPHRIAEHEGNCRGNKGPYDEEETERL